MSTNGSPLNTLNVAPQGSLFGSHQRRDHISGSPDNGSRTAIGKDSHFGKHTDQYHPLQGYGYPPSQHPFPGTPQLYHQSPFNMTLSSQPTNSASQGYPSYGPLWQWYDLHQGGYAGSQMFPPPQCSGQGLWSSGTSRLTPGPPEYNLVNLPISSSSDPSNGPPSSTPGRPPISLPTKKLQPPAEPRKSDVAGSVDLPPSPEISHDDHDADDESDDSLG